LNARTTDDFSAPFLMAQVIAKPTQELNKMSSLSILVYMLN